MSGLRGLGMLGAAVALTGGAAYAAWSYLSAKPKGQPPQQEPPVYVEETHLQQPPHILDEPPLQEPPLLLEESTLQLEQQNTLDTREPSPQERPPPSKQILVLGLDGAGKTSVLHSLATNRVKRSTTPTQGFNAVSINTEDAKVQFLEIGGSESLRSYWNMYLSRAMLLVFVVDSADHVRLPVAKRHLHELTQHDSSLPVMVLANKQDLQDAYCITEIHDALGLSEIGDERKLFLIGTHVAKDGGEIPSSILDAKELIEQLVLDN